MLGINDWIPNFESVKKQEMEKRNVTEICSGWPHLWKMSTCYTKVGNRLQELSAEFIQTI